MYIIKVHMKVKSEALKSYDRNWENSGQDLGVQVVIYRFGHVSQLLISGWWIQLKTHSYKDLSCKYTNKNMSFSGVALIYRGKAAR